MKLDQKVSIITGSTRGIGLVMAETFASEGSRVILVGRDNKEGKAAEKKIQESVGEATYIQTDVSIEEEVRRLVDFTLDKYGKIDILINNAAINLGRGTPFFQLPKDKWRKVLDVNLTGIFLCSKLAAKTMMERNRGTIINLASVHSYATSFGNAPYTTSKGGVLQLTKAMAVDLADYEISVNAIAPGAINTESQQLQENSPLRDYILNDGRAGTREEVASLALFLCSDESGYINGETITIDGGLMSLLPGKPKGIS